MEHITILGSGGFGLSLALSAYRTRCKSLVEVSGRTGSHSARWRAQAKIAGRSDSI